MDRLLFELRSPGRRIRRYRVRRNRTVPCLSDRDASSMDKVEITMIEVIAVKVINRHAECTRTHKRIELLLKVTGCARQNLIAVVLAQRAAPCLRIVHLTYVGYHQKLGIIHDVTCQNYRFSRLDKLFSRHPVDIPDARRLSEIGRASCRERV